MQAKSRDRANSPGKCISGVTVDSVILYKWRTLARLINTKTHLANRFARLNEAMSFLQILQCQLRPFREVAPDSPIIDETRQLLVPLIVFLLVVIDIVMICSRAEPAPDKCERFAHELSAVHVKLGLHDAADFAEGDEDVGDGFDVLLCSRCDVRVFDGDIRGEVALSLQVPDLLRDVFAVVYNVRRTHVSREAFRFGSGSRGDHDR